MHTVLVANRGEIARRVFRTCRALGYGTVAVYSDADRDLPYVREADRAVHIGGSAARDSYLDGGRILLAAAYTGADAIHPGYGFLSENADFADAVLGAGLTWIGPPPSAMRALGDKASARRLAKTLDIPTVPGFDRDGATDADLVDAAHQIGLPVLLKASAGGGGRGMRRVDDFAELPEAIAAARREAISAFGNGHLIVEKYVEKPRHVEVQVFGDAHGRVVHLFERECSVQRRHQKILEEAPSPGVSPEMRERLGACAVRLASAAGYQSAGTVEFLVDGEQFYLLEMNARLQVEHPVTEAVTGLDLVAWQLLVAEGKPLPSEPVALRGHAIEARLYAEDPNRDYLPSTGRLVRFDLGDEIRIEAGFEAGGDVGIHYDAMLAKLIAWGPDRDTANRVLLRACRRAWVPGLVTNLPLLREVLAHPDWQKGELDTGFLSRHGLPGAPPLDLRRGAVVATLYACATRPRQIAQVRPGFRVEGPALQTDRFRAGAEQVDISWRWTGENTVDIDGHVYRVLAVHGDLIRYERDGDVLSARVATHGALTYVHHGDAEAFCELVPRFPPPVVVAEPGTLTAPMPGKVVSVRISVGDSVSAGQVLLVLEAMKMEHLIAAPEAGVVAELRVELGDAVDQGALLVRLENSS